MNTIDHLRNIGIMAHIDAGKTTTTERILYFTGLTHKIGEVHDGTAVMDWMSQEQERGITITSAATSCEWCDHKINILDTPGHVDFTVEVERCLRILDGAIFLLDAKEGVEAQTEAVWHQAEHYQVPRLFFVNKMDIIGADFDASVESIRSRLKSTPLPLQIPIGVEKHFEGVISLVDMKAYYYVGEHGEEVIQKDIPDAYLSIATEKRNEMIESLAEYSDDLMICYLEGEAIENDMLHQVIRKATIQQHIAPVMCGSAYKNKGIQQLLNAILKYLPSPLDRPAVSGVNFKDLEESRLPDTTAPFSALIFKVMTDPYVGRLSYFRVYSGHAKSGGTIINTKNKKKERFNKLLEMHANSRSEVTEVTVGDIVAAVGLKHSTTGDTLTDMNAPIILESIEFPEPVISRAVEPKTPGDFDKMQDALQRLAEEDPTFVTYTHPDTGQILISGMGELHLEIILDRLEKEFNIHCNSGNPQVTYRESIRKPVTVDYTLSKQIGPSLLYAYVKLEVTPRSRGEGHKITLDVKDKNIPKIFLNASYQGVEQSLNSGIIGGYEVIDLHVSIQELKYQEDQSTDVAFITAASFAITEALKQGDSQLLEPISSLQVQVPESYIGDVIDDMNKRHGIISEIEPVATGRIIKAQAPLSKLFGYATDLRSITHGHGHHTMIFSHFDFVK